ncbi:MAG TPA: magnesium and cobalt transport protein CorA [Solirubrobacterales bacterium]|nr:magnesium and cobalt transport protein CorA [Solirubrobacterales bacterium]
MIIDCAFYEKGKRQDGDLTYEQAAEKTRYSGHAGAFVWLGVVDPAETELKRIAHQYGLHELAIEDAIEAHQRPKAEMYGDTLFIVVKTATYANPEDLIEVGELLIFVNPKFVITIRHGGRSLEDVRRRVEDRPDLVEAGPGAVLHQILDRVVDDYGDAAKSFDIDLQHVEELVFAADRRNPAERIYRLEREVIDFYRAVAPLLDVVDGLARGQFDIVNDPLHEYFRDVHDHLQRINGEILGFRDLLSSSLQANLTQVSVRQNEDMRTISAWAAMAAVPTAIAAIYGMNFEHMPELKSPLGYPLVLLLMLSICLYLYWRFKKSGWL